MTSQQPQQPPTNYDQYGLPLNRDEAAPVASSSSNLLGEVSHNRSVGMVSLPPPPLYSGSLRGQHVNLTPPCLSKATGPMKNGKSSPRPVSSNWKIPPASLKCKPDFYPLDPMSKMIPNSCASDIAARISDCLRRRSIAATFGERKPKAKCITADGVEFSIRLYAGKAKYTGGVIVEVQRWSGWAPSYHQDCTAILESTEVDSIGDGDTAQQESFYPGEYIGNEKSNTKSLALSNLLLRNCTIESKELGMESLCSLTDERRCGHVTALNTAQAIFLDSENSHIVALLRNLVVNNKMNHPHTSEAVLKRFRDLALITIFNSFTTLARCRNLDKVLFQNPWVEASLVSTLMSEMKDTSRPHTAAAAARCLNKIIGVSHAATDTAIEMGVLQILDKANYVGTRTHTTLARETKNALTSISQMW